MLYGKKLHKTLIFVLYDPTLSNYKYNIVYAMNYNIIIKDYKN